MVPLAYEHSALIRETWDAAGVHPRDIRTLDDFRERVPFIDKDAVRRFRDERGDPYGGLLCVDPTRAHRRELDVGHDRRSRRSCPSSGAAAGSTSPSIITRDLWGWGVRPGDYVMLVLFTFRGPTYGLFQHSLGTTPILFDFDPDEMERFCELSLEYRPTARLQLRLGADQRGEGRVRPARLRPARRVRRRTRASRSRASRSRRVRARSPRAGASSCSSTATSAT